MRVLRELSIHREGVELAPTPVPPVLYKYYPPERLSEVFENFSVRFSQPGQFNDTFDSNWPASGSMERTARVLFRSKVGIFCLTAEADNHLMWVHYARQHKGFVVGFKSNAGFLATPGSLLKKVNYTPLPGDLPPDSMERCFYKEREWDYEAEWRCVRQISKSTPRDDVFDLTDIVEIVLGEHMADSDINAIVEFVEAVERVSDADLNPINLRFAKANLTSRNIEISESDLAICQTCSGHGHVHRGS